MQTAIILVALLIAVVAANYLAQRALPTLMGDSFGRRYGYTVVARVFAALIAVVIIVLLGVTGILK
jgi:hypothetical protein